MIQIDDSQVLAALATLEARVRTGINGGLADAATVAEDIMQTSPVHGDQSGAAHASYFAGVLGAGAQQRADTAYNAAASLLNGFTGHEGKAARIQVEDSPNPGLIFGSPVDYAADLEAEGRSPVKATMDEMRDFILRMAAEGVKAELGR